jgi:O-antigen/teichoic acid export membrane protein
MPVRDTYSQMDGACTAPVATGMRTAVVGSFAAKSFEMVTVLLVATLVPRSLGPEAYGRFAVPLTIVTLGSLAMSLGGPTLLARYVPAAPAPERLALARAIGARLARGRALQMATVATLATISCLVAPERLPATDTAIVMLALALGVAAGVALQVPLGLGRTGPWALRYPIQNTVLIVAVLLLHRSTAVDGGLVAILLATLVTAGFAAVVLWPIVRAPAARVPIPDGALRFGALHATGAALLQVVHRGGVVLVALLAGASAEAGYTALATGLGLAVTYAVLQAFTVALPHLAADATTDGAEPALHRLATVLLAVLLPATLVVAIGVERLVPLVFGDGYGGAVAAFGPVLAVVVLAPLGSLLVQAAALRLQPEVALANGLAAAAAFVIVGLATIPAWGAVGGTLAALAGIVAGLVVSLRRLPGAASGRLVAGSLLGATAVLAVAALA